MGDLKWGEILESAFKPQFVIHKFVTTIWITIAVAVTERRATEGCSWLAFTVRRGLRWLRRGLEGDLESETENEAESEEESEEFLRK